MSIADLKKEIIERVSSSNDESLLEDLANILINHKSDPKPYILPDAQVAIVNERIERMKQGYKIPSEEADRLIDQRLEEL